MPPLWPAGAETGAAAWADRRAALVDAFADLVYGRAPAAGWQLDATLVEGEAPALDGLARRSQLEVRLSTPRGERSFLLLVHRPTAVAQAPTVLMPNFYGNHATTDDPAVLRTAVASGRTDVPRGHQSAAWPYRWVLGRGHAVATLQYEQLEDDLGPDDPVTGLRDLFPAEVGEGWSALGVWAWGLSRALDVLRRLPGLDPDRVAVAGHSRLGKAALWAGVQDERFAAVLANNSGCAGAALHRHPGGETVADLVAAFPRWARPALARYAGREDELPVDQHQLLALVAPRPLHVASAADDAWADPDGELLATVLATPVYEAHHRTGVRPEDAAGFGDPAGLPVGGTRVGGSLSYHRRPGGHGVTSVDWQHYLDVLDDHVTPHRAPAPEGSP